MANTEHENYRRRKAVRQSFSWVVASILLIFVVDRLFRSNLSALVHLVMLAAGFALIIFANWIIEEQYPDPDPTETKRLKEEASALRAAERKRKLETLAAQKLIDNERRAAAQSERAEFEKQQAAEADIRTKEAEQVAFRILEQHRQNRVSELLRLRTTDPDRADKLAKREGIDLDAEAAARLIAGVAVIGAVIGAGAVAGAEAMRQVIDKAKQNKNNDGLQTLD